MNTVLMLIQKALLLLKGGAGSGNFGHEGRPGERGGSGSGTPMSPSEKKAYGESRKLYERVRDKYNSKKPVSSTDRAELYSAGAAIHGITPQGGSTVHGRQAADSPQGRLYSNLQSLMSRVDQDTNDKEQGFSGPFNRFEERHKL